MNNKSEEAQLFFLRSKIMENQKLAHHPLPSRPSGRPNVTGNSICVLPVTFLKFLYLCGFSPFYLVQTNGIYRISSKKNTIRRAIVCCLSLLVYFTDAREAIANLSRENPVSFFKCFRSSIGCAYKIILLVTFCKRENSFLQIIQHLESCPFLVNCKFPQVFSSQLFWYSIYSGYVVVAGLYGLLGTTSGTCFQSLDIPPLKSSPVPHFVIQRIQTLFVEFRYVLFLSDNANPCKLSFDSATFTDYAFAAVGAVTFTGRFLLGLSCDLFLLIFILTLLFPTIHFISQLRQHKPTGYLGDTIPSLPYHDVISHYKSLRTLSRKINSVVGFIVLLYVGETIFAYPIAIYSLFWSPVILERLLLLFFYCTTAAILISASEICRRVQTVRNWLFETEKSMNVSTSDVILILDDLTQNSVGVSASGIFTLNYSFVGTVTSVVLTYFIIRLQWTDASGRDMWGTSPLAL